MLIKLLNWLCGVLTVRISGVAPERFINLCCNRKLFIWNLQNIDRVYQFNIRAKKFKQLKPIAKKTGIVPEIVEKSGFPFIWHKYRKRYGFFAGILICVLLVYILSLYIWDINILGGSKYTPETLLEFLRDNDVYAGIRKKHINCQEIEESIRLAYKDIGWVSAEIKGTRLIIKITETNMPAPVKKADRPSHMVASKNAVVKSIITRSGIPLVKKGDVVKKGDILVSGIVAIKSDFDEIIRFQPLVADADIICSSYYDYEDVFSLEYLEAIYTGRVKKGYYVALTDKKLFLYNPSNSYDKYDIIVSEKVLHITDSFYLPIRYGTITSREYYEVKKRYSEDEAIALAQGKLQRYLDKLAANNVLITQNNVTITIENGYCIAKGRILVEEPAWEYKEVSDDEWRIEGTDEHN